MLIQDPKDEVNLISNAPSFQTFACSKVFVSARETANIFKHKMLIYIYMYDDLCTFVKPFMVDCTGIHSRGADTRGQVGG